MSKRSPFDFVKSIWNSKEYLIDNVEIFNKEYTPFIVNRALSNSDIGVLFANEMNKYQVDKDMQYDFYYHGIPQQRGYLKWAKKEADVDSDSIKLIQQLYDVSEDRALEYLNIINKNDLISLKNIYGGK